MTSTTIAIVADVQEITTTAPTAVLEDQPNPCNNAQVLYPGGVDWAFDPQEHLVTACRDGQPISSVTDGPGEVFFSMDSNHDGIEELVVGGTSVAGGGGTLYSLINDRLGPILVAGKPLFIKFGHGTEGTFHDWGCDDGHLVNARFTASGVDATAERTHFQIDLDHAIIVNTERVEWTLDAPIDPFDGSLIAQTAPFTTGLSDCFARPSFDQVFAAKPDGTLLLASIEAAPDNGDPCANRMPMVAWKGGAVQSIGSVDGVPFQSGAQRIDGPSLHVMCNGVAALVATNWGERIWGSTPGPVQEPHPSFPLAGTDLTLSVELLPQTEDRICETDPRSARVVVSVDNGPRDPWLTPSEEPLFADWIEWGDFVSTADGRFVLLVRSTCEHEGPMKSVVSGTYEPGSGNLLTFNYLELPDDYRTERGSWIYDFPDVISVDTDGQIIGWLGTGDDVQSVVLSQPK